jgi:hypothetical protein
MADALLNTKQLSDILLRLEQIMRAVQTVRNHVIQSMADRHTARRAQQSARARGKSSRKGAARSAHLS